MPLLPYDTLLIESPFPVDEVRGRLQGATGPVRWFRFGAPTHPFMGEVADDDVRIHRAIGYQNSFLPRVAGRIEPTARGSRLTATMTLQPWVTVFIGVWMAMALAAAIPLLVLALTSDPPLGIVLIPVGMLLLGWAVASGAFTLEAHIARAQLTELLQGHRAVAVPPAVPAGADHPPATSAAPSGAPVRPHPGPKA